MATAVTSLKSVEYRVVLIEPDSCALIALDTGDGCKLPAFVFRQVCVPYKSCESQSGPHGDCMS